LSILTKEALKRPTRGARKSDQILVDAVSVTSRAKGSVASKDPLSRTKAKISSQIKSQRSTQADVESETSTRIKTNIKDALYNAFPLLKKDPEETLRKQIEEHNADENNDSKVMDSSTSNAHAIAQLDALKRFIETMEKDAIQEKRIAQQVRLQNT
jgi:hypothetical protein